MTPALVGFRSTEMWWGRFLAPGFGHVAVAVPESSGVWLGVEALADTLPVQVLGDEPDGIREAWVAAGYLVVRTFIRPRPFRQLLPEPLTCVTIAKRALNIVAPLVVTPRQLHRHLTRAVS